MELTELTVTTKTNLGPLYKGIKVCQRFVASENNLCAISLWLATYRRRVDALARFQILDTDNRVILRQVEINTKHFTDNTWQRFAFDPIADSRGKIYWFCLSVDCDSNEPLTLWTNNTIRGMTWKNELPLDEGICFICDYLKNIASLLDPLLFQHLDEFIEISSEASEHLHQIIWHCIHTKDLYFLRLAHLADAFGKTQGVSSVLSVGCGMAYQEAFFAGRFPNIQVLATDIVSTWNNFPFDNLSFSQSDILDWMEAGEYDFVVSIETLEHIEDYHLAFKNLAMKVKPGKYLYISVPFASLEEQRDVALRQREWEDYGHYLPGFTFEDLESLFDENGFDIIHSSNMFSVVLTTNLNKLLGKLDANSIDSTIAEIGRLFLMDVSDRKVDTRQEAVGIRILGQKRA